MMTDFTHKKTQSQPAEKTRLIHEVIAKVDDPELRRKILANIVNDRGAGAPRTGRRRRERRSFVKEELLAWGVDPEIVDDYMKFCKTMFWVPAPKKTRETRFAEKLPDHVQGTSFWFRLCSFFY